MRLTTGQLKRIISNSVHDQPESRLISEAVVFLAGPFLAEALKWAIIGYVGGKAYSAGRKGYVADEVMKNLGDIPKLEEAADKIAKIAEQAEICNDKNLQQELQFLVTTGTAIEDVMSGLLSKISPDESDRIAAEGESLAAMAIGSRNVGPVMRGHLLKAIKGIAWISLAYDVLSTEAEIKEFQSIDFGRYANTIQGFDIMYDQMHDGSGNFIGYLPCKPGRY